MCSPRSNPFDKRFNPFDPVDMQHLYGEVVQGPKFDRLLHTYDSLHFLGGGALADVQGLTRRDELRANRIENNALAYQKQQYAPAAPEKTLASVEMNADVRDKRRRAALLGTDQLRTAAGPGVATGGGYGGAVAPTY